MVGDGRRLATELVVMSASAIQEIHAAGGGLVLPVPLAGGAGAAAESGDAGPL